MNYEKIGAEHGEVAADMVREGTLVTNEDVSQYMSKRLELMGHLPNSVCESWIEGFNVAFDKNLERNMGRTAEISSMEYKDGFSDAIDRVLRKPLLEMHEHRKQDLDAAGKSMSFGDFVKYTDGYDAGMKQQIQDIGARQALRDKGLHGATEQAMEGYLSVAQWVRTEEHRAAFVTGYKRESKLDRDPIAKQQDNQRKMGVAVIKQEIKQNQAYNDGFRQASAIVGSHGLKSAIERMSIFFTNLKKSMQPKTLEMYSSGFKHGIRTHVRTMANSLAIKAASMGNDRDINMKIKDHFNGAGKILNSEMYNVFSREYEGTFKQKRKSLNKDNKSLSSVEAGKTFEVKKQDRKLQEHTISR